MISHGGFRTQVPSAALQDVQINMQLQVKRSFTHPHPHQVQADQLRQRPSDSDADLGQECIANLLQAVKCQVAQAAQLRQVHAQEAAAARDTGLCVPEDQWRDHQLRESWGQPTWPDGQRYLQKAQNAAQTHMLARMSMQQQLKQRVGSKQQQLLPACVSGRQGLGRESTCSASRAVSVLSWCRNSGSRWLESVAVARRDSRRSCRHSK